MTKYLYAKQFYFTDDIKGPGYLPILEDGTLGTYQTETPDGEILDYSNYSIAPGLVDTHIHGFMSHDVMDNSAEGIRAISAGLPSCGVTSYLPTTLTAPREQLNDVCETVGKVANEGVAGAKIQGIFLEGPFFSEVYKGAQNPSYMSDPVTDYLDEWQRLSDGWVKKIALAPEREGAVDFIKHAKANNIYSALAHTDATYEECRLAVEAGANIFVHTYNGMRGLHHREPGVVGSALTLGQYDELICDGHHVHPVSAKIVMHATGPEKTVLITDCMRAGGMGECESTLGEFDVIVKDGTARLKHNGSLAGSILELIQGVQNVVNWGIATPAEALRMASLNPAASVGIDDRCGKIDPGYPADFIVLDDDLNLKATFIDGQNVYTN